MQDLDLYFPVAEAISELLHPHGEVIIHDLKTGKIAAIYNNISKRKVGDPSLISNVEEYKKLPEIFPIYSQLNWEGRKMKSSSATLRDKKGEAMGLLCINLDISTWEELHHFLGGWLGNLIDKNPSEVVFKE